MGSFPSLRVPVEGEPISDDGLAYVKRASSRSQAAGWNEAIYDDPVFGIASGFKVGVGPCMDGRFPLVWVRAEATDVVDWAPTASAIPGWPAITTPAEGVRLGRELAYGRRDTALTQAVGWNDTLRDHPVYGRASGFVVAAGAAKGGQYPLIWIRLAAS